MCITDLILCILFYFNILAGKLVVVFMLARNM